MSTYSTIAKFTAGQRLALFALRSVFERQVQDCTPIEPPYTCERSCGPAFRICIAWPTCYNPSAGEVCCSNGDYCPEGQYCTNNGCCPEGTTLAECNASVSLGVIPPSADTTSVPAVASTGVTAATTASPSTSSTPVKSTSTSSSASPTASPKSKSSQKSCPSGWTNCGDTCASLLTDPINCGACGAVCSAPSDSGLGICSAGVCNSVSSSTLSSSTIFSGSTTSLANSRLINSTTSLTSSTRSTLGPTHHSSLSSGTAAGIGIGCALVSSLLTGLLVFLVLQKRRRATSQLPDVPPQEGRGHNVAEIGGKNIQPEVTGVVELGGGQSVRRKPVELSGENGWRGKGGGGYEYQSAVHQEVG